MSDVFNPGLVGSTDWTGGVAPEGGIHSGTSTLTLADGTNYVVRHSRAESIQKVHSAAPVPAGTPQWVAFDQPGRAIPLTLDVRLVKEVR